MPMIPPMVTVEGDILGEIGNLMYFDHDLEKLNKFLELAPHIYLSIVMKL
jgi:hypothetical protein